VIQFYEPCILYSVYENARKESSWTKQYLNLSSYKADDSAVPIILKNIQKIRTQKSGGRSDGFSVALDPQLDDNFCSPYNRPGFMVKW